MYEFFVTFTALACFTRPSKLKEWPCIRIMNKMYDAASQPTIPIGSNDVMRHTELGCVRLVYSFVHFEWPWTWPGHGGVHSFVCFEWPCTRIMNEMYDDAS